MSNILEQLNNEELISKSVSLTEEIKGNFSRMPHNHINVLYVLKEFLGEKCNTYLEIGVLWGGSLSLVLQHERNCNHIGVDLFTNHNWEHNDMNVVKENVDRVNKHGHDFNLIKGDCCSYETLNTVKECTPNGIDLLFIDGDHSTPAVIRDFLAYKDFVNSGGFIVFDDYGFLPEVKQAIDIMIGGSKKIITEEEFELVGQLDLGEGSSDIGDLYLNNGLNASYIIRKK